MKPRKSAELQKDSPRFQSRLGWIQYHAKHYDAAPQAYAALIEKFDKTHDTPEVREVLRDARLVLSNIAVLEGKLLESEEWLEQVLDEFPEDVGALNDLGYLWADPGKHLDRPGHDSRPSTPSPRTWPIATAWVGYCSLGRYPEAVAELQAAAGVEEPDGVILDHLGRRLQKSGERRRRQSTTWRGPFEGSKNTPTPEKANNVQKNRTGKNVPADNKAEKKPEG